jgi:transposase
MPKPLQIELSAAAKQELEQVRDTSPKAYLRERAAAILKIAAGQSASEVARRGLLKRRQYQTICHWVQRYQTGGIQSLGIGQGRGRKAAFSPSLPD